MWPVLGGLLGGVGSALGSIFGASQTNEANQAMQQQSEAYNTQMSNTAYQRASTDMQKAGLNPMMMFGSGSAASSPTAPPVQMQSGLQSAGNSIGQAISSATALKTADATIDNLVEQNAKIKAETLTEGARTSNVVMDTALKDQQGYGVEAERKLREAELPVVLNRALSAKNEQDMNPTARRLLDQAGFTGQKAADVVSPIGSLVSSARHALTTYRGY